MAADRDPYAFAECLILSSPTLRAYVGSGAITRAEAIQEIGDAIAAQWARDAAAKADNPGLLSLPMVGSLWKSRMAGLVRVDRVEGTGPDSLITFSKEGLAGPAFGFGAKRWHDDRAAGRLIPADLPKSAPATAPVVELDAAPPSQGTAAQAEQPLEIGAVTFERDEAVVFARRGSLQKAVRISQATWAAADTAEKLLAVIEPIWDRQLFFEACPTDEAYRAVLEAGYVRWGNGPPGRIKASEHHAYRPDGTSRLMWTSQEAQTLTPPALVALVQKRFRAAHGIALNAASHPHGPPADEDAGLDPASLETVERDISDQSEPRPAMLPKRGGWKARHLAPDARPEPQSECRRLIAAEVPAIPDEREHVEEGGLKIDAILDGDHCRWRLRVDGTVRVFVRYWPKVDWPTKGSWREAYF